MTKPHQGISLNSIQRQAESTEPLWTVEDVSGYLRLNPETVRHMARIGKIPCVKIGKVWRFRPDIIKNWLQVMDADIKEE